MINTSFYLRNGKCESTTPIHMRISHKGQSFKLSVGEKIHPELWDRGKQSPTTVPNLIVKHNNLTPGTKDVLLGIRSKLSNIVKAVNRYYANCTFDDKPIVLNNLKKKLRILIDPSKERNSSSSKVCDYLETFIDRAEMGVIIQPNGNDYSPGTVKNYKNLLQSIQRFERHYGQTLYWESFGRDEYTQYMQWHENQGYSINYKGKHAKDLKALMHLAYDEGIHVNQSFRSKWFAVPSERPEKFPLTSDEIDKLYDLELDDGSTMCKARDVFLIGYFTGLRIGDIKRLGPKNIIYDNGKKRVKVLTGKNKHMVLIPVNSRLEKILDRNNNRCPAIARPTVNRYIKRIALMAGIPKEKAQKLITHVGRHSFTTTLALQGIPSIDIMQMTGHKTEKSFRRYLNISLEETASRMEDKEFFK